VVGAWQQAPACPPSLPVLRLLCSAGPVEQAASASGRQLIMSAAGLMFDTLRSCEPLLRLSQRVSTQPRLQSDRGQISRNDRVWPKAAGPLSRRYRGKLPLTQAGQG
jgi:hypothetical protein